MTSRLCVTRALKNLAQIRTRVPELARELDRELQHLRPSSFELLGRLHRRAGPSAAWPLPDASYADRLRLAQPGMTAAAPLFSGTLHFVKFTFTTKGGDQTLAEPDLETALAYARHALGPIGRYAGQYGPTSTQIAPELVPWTIALPDGSYSDATVKQWVDELAAQQHLPTTDAVVLLNPPSVRNTDAPVDQGVLGYHGFAQIPYAFVNVLGSGLSVPDPGDLYALAPSHELAEMIVDPRADDANPEVADGCGPNCQTVFRDYFSATGAYLGTDTTFPPSYDYGFYINAIVRPASATACPAPASACQYPPPG